MALVNLSLLLGGGAIAIPIVLHLLLRQQPKRLMFPAIRFLQERQDSNRRRLQLRHLLLLLLRCLGVLLVAATFARPSVATAALGNWLLVPLAGLMFVAVSAVVAVAAARRRGKAWVVGGSIAALLLALLTVGLVLRALGMGTPRMLGDQEAPVAAALLFDTASRMDYRFENRTRLEAAKEAADWVVRQLPEGSDLAVVDARPNAPVFSQDRAAAMKAIERLETSGVTQPLPESFDACRIWLEQSGPLRKELYVFTDSSRGAWPASAATNAAESATVRLPDGIDVYVIDVGVERPRNAGLGELRLTSQTLPPSGELEIVTEVAATGLAGARSVELLVDKSDANRPLIRDGKVEWPEETPRGRQEVALSESAAATVSFRLSGLPPGTVHGKLRLIGEDGLASDDERYFTVLVQEAAPVLVVAPAGVVAKYFVEAIAPLEYRQAGRSEFTCAEIAPSALAEQTLDAFAALCLLDPPPLSTEDWGRLARFVEAGGGLGVFLGHNAQAGSTFQDPIAERLLGGRLHRRWRAPSGDVYLAPDQFDHPVTREFRAVSTTVPWDRFPVYRHWEFEPLAATTRTLIRFGNGLPALLETNVGRGRVLVLTTPLSDPARPRGRDSWNELPTAPDAWPFVMLADQMTQHLAGSRALRLNFVTGQSGEWVGRLESEPEKYQLFLPSGATQDVATRDGRTLVKSTEQPGQYRLRGFRNGVLLHGFSVNLPPAATDLTRAAREDLDRWLGANRYQSVRNQEDMRRRLGEARTARGLEFYPFLLLLLVAVLGLEQLLANRFYGSTP